MAVSSSSEVKVSACFIIIEVLAELESLLDIFDDY